MLTYRITGVCTYMYVFVYTYIKLICIYSGTIITKFNPVTVVTVQNIWGIIFVGSSQRLVNGLFFHFRAA